jgi:hypothetical protein
MAWPAMRARAAAISPASTIVFSHRHSAAARWTGRSNESRRGLLAAPAYSLSARPSGRCCALACDDNLRRVGRQKRERSLFIPAVLGEIEVHAADETPRRAPMLEKLLDRPLRFGEFGSKRGRGLSPERCKNRGRDVLGAGHRRHGRGERLEFLHRGRRYGRVVRLEIGMHADRRHQPRGEVAPVAKVCWKDGSDLRGAELEQSVARAASKRAFEPARERGRWLDGLVRHGEQQVAARRQRQRWHADGSPRSVMVRWIATVTSE